MLETHEIIIREAFEHGPLNVDERILVNAGDTVTWTLRDGTLADSLRRIEVKSDSYNIFERGYPICEGNTCTGKIRRDAGGRDCNYTIVWLDHYRTEKRHDPIISVRPTIITSEGTGKTIPIPKLLIGLAIGLVAVLSLQFLRKKK